jgi:gliding motility-associated-like protein
VSIYNQWGDEVYHASPYFNDWEGTYDGQELPVGTYFFVVKYNNDQPPVSGFLVLER